MKKVTKLIAGVVLAASVAVTAGALVGCGGEEEKTYTGEYSYSVTYGTSTSTYGVKVDVTVSGDKIKAVAYSATQPEGWHNITPTWKENAEKGQLGYDKTNAGLADYLAKFEGKTVDEVLAINVSKSEAGVPNTDEAAHTAMGDLLYSGATQTGGRLILAVQDALKDVK